MKSQEEIQALKDNWRHDPCYDIEDTDGFEGHREELKAYSDGMKMRWKEQVQKHHDDLAAKVCPLSFQRITNQGYGFTWQTCLVEQCALWDEAMDCCSLKRTP